MGCVGGAGWVSESNMRLVVERVSHAIASPGPRHRRMPVLSSIKPTADRGPTSRITHFAPVHIPAARGVEQHTPEVCAGDAARRGGGPAEALQRSSGALQARQGQMQRQG